MPLARFEPTIAASELPQVPQPYTAQLLRSAILTSRSPKWILLYLSNTNFVVNALSVVSVCGLSEERQTRY